MGVGIRLPKVTATTEAGQLKQLQSYMYQLVEQLNWALSTIESSSSGDNSANAMTAMAYQSAKQNSSNDTFNDIKGLIIKSADIINAYYDEISTRLDSLYVAESDFGTYTEETSQLIKETATAVENIHSDIQTIKSTLSEIEGSELVANAYIRTGLLYYDDDGLPVYGVEVGQQNTVNGVEVFNKFARFTSNRLSFFDQNGKEVAWVSDKKLYIGNVEVMASYKIGGLKDIVMANGDVVEKWVGIGGEE